MWIDKKNTNNVWVNDYKKAKKKECGLTRKIQTMGEGGSDGLLQKAKKMECGLTKKYKQCDKAVNAITKYEKVLKFSLGIFFN